VDPTKFLIADVSFDDIDDAHWLVDDTDSRYAEMDALDVSPDTINRVFEIYRLAYSGLNNTPLIAEPNALLAYNRWILLREASTAEGPGPVAAFALFKVKAMGLKAGLKASDGQRASKRAIIRFAIASYNAPGVFGEISPPLETKLAGDVPVVPVDVALDVLARLGKRDVRPTHSNHYTRRIGALGEVEKLMVGYPVGSDEEREGE
jgi:hypothetical protein